MFAACIAHRNLHSAWLVVYYAKKAPRYFPLDSQLTIALVGFHARKIILGLMAIDLILR